MNAWVLSTEYSTLWSAVTWHRFGHNVEMRDLSSFYLNGWPKRRQAGALQGVGLSIQTLSSFQNLSVLHQNNAIGETGCELAVVRHHQNCQ